MEPTMISNSNLTNRYLECFPKEQALQKRLLAFLENNKEYKKQIDRKNLQGHVTGSAIIVHRSLTKVLMIEHKAHKKPLPPGGHVEATDKSIFGKCLSGGLGRNRYSKIAVVIDLKLAK